MKNNILTSLILACLMAFTAMAQGEKADKEEKGVKKAKAEKAADKKAKRAKIEKEVYAFLDEHFPGRKAELDKILADEGKKAHREAFRMERDLYRDYQDVLEFDGEEMAGMLIEEAKVYRELEPLIAKYEELDEDDPERAKVRAKAEPHVTKLMDMEAKLIEEELALMKEDGEDEDFIEEVEGMLAEIKEAKKDPEAAFDLLIESMNMDFEDGDFGVEELELEAKGGAKAELPENWHTDPDKAMAAAKESGKLIHVVFSTSWCPPCQAMVKNVYPKENVKEALEDFEALYVDGDIHRDLCKKYKVRGFPTFLMIDADGEVAHTCKAGGMNVDRFIGWLEDKK